MTLTLRLKGRPVFLWSLVDVKQVRLGGTGGALAGQAYLVFDFHYEGEGLAGPASGISGIGKGGLGVLGAPDHLLDLSSGATWRPFMDSSLK